MLARIHEPDGLKPDEKTAFGFLTKHEAIE